MDWWVKRVDLLSTLLMIAFDGKTSLFGVLGLDIARSSIGVESVSIRMVNERWVRVFDGLFTSQLISNQNDSIPSERRQVANTHLFYYYLTARESRYEMVLPTKIEADVPTYSLKRV